MSESIHLRLSSGSMATRILICGAICIYDEQMIKDNIANSLKNCPGDPEREAQNSRCFYRFIML
jgi:hypothetical protein